ncbi:helix-turn-helix domain-containing protein [Streptosporangium sandarakinum]
MDDVIERAVLRVVESMYENPGKQTTVDDMARTAMYSKAHFSRAFRRATGLSPGRFLSAVRLQEAKRLLGSTTLSITNISLQVGYSSISTFSSRFTSSVGLSPSNYRLLGSITSQALSAGRGQSAQGPTVTVRGRLSSPLKGRPIFAGLFPNRILEGHPVSYTLLDGPGPFTLKDVPEGRWHLIAQSVAADYEGAVHLPGGGETLCLARQAITVWSDAEPQPVDVLLRPMRLLDPPTLLALRDLLAPDSASVAEIAFGRASRSTPPPDCSACPGATRSSLAPTV